MVAQAVADEAAVDDIVVTNIAGVAVANVLRNCSDVANAVHDSTVTGAVAVAVWLMLLVLLW